ARIGKASRSASGVWRARPESRSKRSSASEACHAESHRGGDASASIHQSNGIDCTRKTAMSAVAIAIPWTGRTFIVQRCHLHFPRAALPVAVAELALEYLAVRIARQLGDELEGARAFVCREVLLAERRQIVRR